MRWLSDRLFRSDSSSYARIRERLADAIREAVGGYDDVLDLVVDTGIRHLRTSGYLVRYTPLNPDIDDEQVWAGIQGENPGNIVLLDRWKLFAERLAKARKQIAVMQSLSRQGAVDPLVENYGQVIVDECHHIGAASFDAILRRAKAKYVLGLTATPIRRDGQQPIIFMQCVPIRHKAAQPAEAPHDLAVLPQFVEASIALPPDAGIQDVFRHLAQDQARTTVIANAITDAFRQGRKVLALTERTDHIDAIRVAFTDEISELFVLHGRMSRRQRAALIAALDALPPDAPRVLLATGKLVGEGFDHPPLDTLVLAMPVSWKGTLQQYAGRLHREHANKTDVRIVDFVDTDHAALL